MKEIYKYFTPEIRFPSRGSILLWRDLSEECKKLDIETSSQFKNTLFTLFQKLTGYDIQENEYVRIDKYYTGKGISSGMVNIPWWRIIGIPVLVKRFAENKSPCLNEKTYIQEKKVKNKNILNPFRGNYEQP